MVFVMVFVMALVVGLSFPIRLHNFNLLLAFVMGLYDGLDQSESHLCLS
jgi:hypothetical protein